MPPEGITPLKLPPRSPPRSPSEEDFGQNELAPEKFRRVQRLATACQSGTELWKVVHIERQVTMAEKRVAVPQDSRKYQHLVNEVEIMRKSNSPYLIKYFGRDYSEGRMSLYMEFMDCGSFDQVYKKYGRLPESILSVVADSALKGLQYLESNKWIHRDIKPSNIVVNENGDVKLCDFGISRVLRTLDSVARTYVGTKFYMSPERLEGKAAWIGADIWSLGLSCVELAIGRFPKPKFATSQEEREWLLTGKMSLQQEKDAQEFLVQAAFELLDAIQTQPPPTVPLEFFSAVFKDFVDVCQTQDPDQRPKVAELLHHNFLLTAEESKVKLSQWLHSKADVGAEAV